MPLELSVSLIFDLHVFVVLALAMLFCSFLRSCILVLLGLDQVDIEVDVQIQLNSLVSDYFGLETKQLEVFLQGSDVDYVLGSACRSFDGRRTVLDARNCCFSVILCSDLTILST